MVYRIYVEKKAGLDNEAKALLAELTTLLGIKALTGVRFFNRYDVENLDESLFLRTVSDVFSEPQLDVATRELPETDGVVFATEYLPGQFDQRADSAMQCIRLMAPESSPLVRTARVYVLEGELTEADVEKIKKYVINPVECREASLNTVKTLQADYASRSKTIVNVGHL